MQKPLSELNAFGDTKDFMKKLETNRIKLFWVPMMKAEKEKIKKAGEDEIRKAAKSTKETIENLYNKLDTSESMMGAMAKKVKQVVGEQKNKYDESLPV